jgi:hypothetical protein
MVFHDVIGDCPRAAVDEKYWIFRLLCHFGDSIASSSLNWRGRPLSHACRTDQ